VANESAEQFDARLEAECEEFGDEDKDESKADEDKKRPARRRPPEHLPIQERVIEPPASELEGEPMKCIGYVEAHTLDWKPGHFIHIVTKRAKYAPLDGDGPVITAPPPPQVIVRGLAEPGLLAHVIVSKYADHLPLNRLIKIFAREGVDVAMSTMVGWIRDCSKMLAPLVSLLGELVLQSHVLQTDDTGIQVLDPSDPDGSKRGHIWGYVGDQQLVYFQYTPDWKADATRQFLEARIAYLTAVRQATERVSTLTAKIEAFSQLEPYADLVAALRCFRGIDTITAMTFVTELHGFQRFEDPRQLMAYLGLVPSEHTSDGKGYRGSITKAGNGHVRRVLVEAAWHYRHKPRCGWQLRKRRLNQLPSVIAHADKAMKRLNQRWHTMQARNKPNAKIVVALARELVGFLWAVLTETIARRQPVAE
jgi:transposase